MAKFMFLETEYGRYRELLYASCVAKRIADEVRKLGHEVIEVQRPSPSDANDAIRREKPDVVWWVGHGNANTTTLERVQVWIKAPDYNTDILNGMGACALSCLTGRYLGKYVTEERDCKAYLGYRDLFYFMWCADPWRYNCACQGRNPWEVRPELWKKMVECMHEANLYWVLGLAKGMTAKEAYDFSIQRFNYWINYFENVKPKDKNEASVIRTVLWVLTHDRDCQVLYGDPNWKVPVPTPVPYVTMGGIALGLLALSAIATYTHEKGWWKFPWE